jgi:hypothetical protein
MGVDYKWGGSTGGSRFRQEIDRVVKLFGGKRVEESKGPNKFWLPDGTNPCVVKFFDHLYGPLSIDETKEVWNEFQKHPQIKKIMPDMWNEFKCDATYGEGFELSY